MKRRCVWGFAVPVLIALAATGAPAQVPGEITGVLFTGPLTATWDPQDVYDTYNVYRGGLSDLAAGVPARCRQFDIVASSTDLPGEPAGGDGFYYLVTGERNAVGDGPTGVGTSGDPRPILGSCVPFMQNHVLDRLGYGWGEWTSERIDTLGFEAYIAEQLDPASIDESTNAVLNGFLGPIDPPTTIFQLIQQQVIRATYARRQLEQQVATFWANHFNTDWAKVADIFQNVFPECQSPGQPPQCDPNYPTKAYEAASLLQNKEIETFRDLGFNGNFREIVESSSVSLAMIIYLDSFLSIAGSPNENYPRELMELHTMGVDCGYEQPDIEELSRIITGWTGCKKETAVAGNPLAPCIQQYWLDTPPGEWVAFFVPENHDCTSKTLFAGTPYETFFPDTCATPALGVTELYTALDVIAAHPCTAEFISRKILQRFVTDDPDQALVDELVTVWNDPGNPNGIGDLGAVLTAALTSETFLDPDTAGSKVKTPLEYVVSALRGTRGTTDGLTVVLEYMVSMGHIPHFNPVPTGWPEDGASWIGTNNTLDRQNFAFQLFDSPFPIFTADPIGLLEDNGVSTTPGHAEDIVDFFSRVLFGGALTPAERQAAIDYMNTDDSGNPSDYDDARILEAIGAMMGYPQFQEQ